MDFVPNGTLMMLVGGLYRAINCTAIICSLYEGVFPVYDIFSDGFKIGLTLFPENSGYKTKKK